MFYKTEECSDCREEFSTQDMEFDYEREEWVCDDCFNERSNTAWERDQDDI